MCSRDNTYFKQDNSIGSGYKPAALCNCCKCDSINGSTSALSEHNKPFWVQERRTHLCLWNCCRQDAVAGADIWPRNICRLSPLVSPWIARHMERVALCENCLWLLDRPFEFYIFLQLNWRWSSQVSQSILLCSKNLHASSDSTVPF